MNYWSLGYALLSLAFASLCIYDLFVGDHGATEALILAMLFSLKADQVKKGTTASEGES